MSEEGELFPDFPEDEKPEPEWVRLRGGVAGVWRHRSGWTVHRCGHPTALWPYYGLRPEGGIMLLTGGFGVGIGFQTLKKAKAAVEAELQKEQ